MASRELNKLKKRLGFLKTIATSVKIMFEACDRRTIALFSIGLLASAVPAVLLHLQKEFFARAELLSMNASQTILTGIIGVLIIWNVLNIITWLIGIVGSYAGNVLYKQVNNHMMDSLLDKIAAIRYEYMDTPEVYNKLGWVSSELPNRIAQVIYGTLNMIGNLISLGSMGILVYTENWRIGALVLVGSIPACIFAHMQNNEGYYQAQWQSAELRQQWYVYNLFVKRDSIREMRIGQYSEYLIQKWEDLSLKLRNHRYKFIRKYYLFNLLTNITGYVTIGLALWLVCRDIFDPTTNVGIGSFVLIYGVARGLQGTIKNIFGNVSQVATTGKYIQDYLDFQAYDQEDLTGEDGPIPTNADINFENVSFHYPNTERLVLKDINVSIKQGEKIAIVGENGSGKTTFVALLGGLYRPQTGKITFAGQDLSEAVGLMRRSTSFVFQDFGKYQLTVAENIRIGHMYKDLTPEEIEAAAKASGADKFIQKLDNQYDTFLGTLEEGHTDFSGGEWQKLAFARAITRRDARVMVLDEQTAALDPISEAKFYHDFRDLTGDRTAIMISHRLGATKLADRILVFHEGEIVEEGTHEDLMKTKGLYAEMYAAQSQWYSA